MNKFKTYTSMLGSSNWTAINNNLTLVFGDIAISAVYSRLLSLQEYFGENNDFFQTYEQIGAYFALNRYQTSKAVLFLVNSGFISCVKKGIPAKSYYHFSDSNFDKLEVALNEYYLNKSEISSCSVLEQLEKSQPNSLNNDSRIAIISKSKEVNNIDLPVFSKNDHAHEIESLRSEIEELKSILKQQKENTEAEGAKCNNVANNELAVLSAQIGTSYVIAQESKDKPLRATKTRKNEKISIDSQIEFQSYENFAKYWSEKLESKYPEIDCQKCYDWFYLTIKSKYDFEYSDYSLVLQRWLRDGSEATGNDWRARAYATILKHKRAEQYNNEAQINEMLERTKGQPTTMDKIHAKANEVWEKYMNDQNNK